MPGPKETLDARLGSSALNVRDQGIRPSQYKGLEDYFASPQAQKLVSEFEGIYPTSTHNKDMYYSEATQIRAFRRAAFRDIAEMFLASDPIYDSEHVFYRGENVATYFKTTKSGDKRPYPFGRKRVVVDGQEIDTPDAMQVELKANKGYVSKVYAFAVSKDDTVKVQKQYDQFCADVQQGIYTSAAAFIVVAPRGVTLVGITPDEYQYLPFHRIIYNRVWMGALVDRGYEDDLERVGFSVPGKNRGDHMKDAAGEEVDWELLKQNGFGTYDGDEHNEWEGYEPQSYDEDDDTVETDEDYTEQEAAYLASKVREVKQRNGNGSTRRTGMFDD